MRLLAIVLMLVSSSVSADFFPEAKPEGQTNTGYEQHNKAVQKRIQQSVGMSAVCKTNIEKYQKLADAYELITPSKRSALDNLKYDHVKSELASLKAYCNKQ